MKTIPTWLGDIRDQIPCWCLIGSWSLASVSGSDFNLKTSAAAAAASDSAKHSGGKRVSDAST